MSPAEDVYLFVVVGAMNPAIHHPSWYQLTHILSEEEAAKASQSGVVVTSPQIAQFSVGSISITCDPERWQIQTSEENDLQRIVEITDKTFEVLYHTPVSAFGFNAMHHRVVSLSNAPVLLGRMVRGLPVGFIGSGTGDEAAKLSYERSVDGRVIRTVLEPSVRGPNQIYVAINVEHRIQFEKPDTFEQFDLNVADHFPQDRRDAEEQLASVLRAVAELGRGEQNSSGA